jgi:hypothetical protein
MWSDMSWFGHGEDQGRALGVADALVAVNRLGVEVDGVAGVQGVELAVVRYLEVEAGEVLGVVLDAGDQHIGAIDLRGECGSDSGGIAQTNRHDVLDAARSVIRKAISVVDSMPRGEEAASYTELQVSLGDEFWRFDKVEDFFAKFPSAEEGAISYDFPLSSPYWRCIMLYTWSSLGSTVSVNSEHAHQINTVMNVFNGSLELAFDSHKGDMSSEADVNPEFNIFIGHGRSKDWEELRNHLQDKHHYKVISFETGARAGHQIRDILDEMLDRSSLAFLILTGEDETEDHKIRARQNVIHELGHRPTR